MVIVLHSRVLPQHGVEMMAAHLPIRVVAMEGWARLLLREKDLCGHVMYFDKGGDSIVRVRLGPLLCHICLRPSCRNEGGLGAKRV